MYGNKIQTKARRGRPVGGSQPRAQLLLHDARPGDHYFCSKGENKSVCVKVEAGKTYFVEQKIKRGFMKAPQQAGPAREEEVEEEAGQVPPELVGGEEVGVAGERLALADVAGRP